MSAGKLVVGYWKIRGLGAPLRMLCYYAGAEFTPACYEVVKKEDGSWDRSAWFSVKPDLQAKNPFMNLPYIVDGETVVTQSNPCLTYLGRKFNLNGSTPEQLTLVEQVIAQAFDLRNEYSKLFYGPKAAFEEGMTTKSYAKHFTKFDDWLGFYKSEFTVGNQVTTGDFPLWEMVDQIVLAANVNSFPEPFDGYPHLAAFHKRFRDLPALQGYFNCQLYHYPCNQVFASFSSTASAKK